MICTACGEEKDLPEFERTGKTKRRQCKKCRREVSKKWKINNPDKIAVHNRKWLLGNPEKRNIYKRIYRERHPDKIREERLRYRDRKRKITIKIRVDKTSAEYKKMVADRQKLWKKNNPEKIKEYSRRQGLKRQKNQMTRLHRLMTSAIGSSLRGKKGGRSWESLVGYTCSQLKKHLEEKFLPGMSWENRAEWHIDHKIPKSAFNFEKPGDIDFKKCWALKNLQPLWAFDNIKKRDYLFLPHQPSLLI